VVTLGESIIYIFLQDDHMIHRGHGVFDTALVIDGNLIMLDRHLLRLGDSAIKVYPPPSYIERYEFGMKFAC
jgi:branched-subunit amino acid aminotransferase/4-amino-4-deoxychorismate lyase